MVDLLRPPRSSGGGRPAAAPAVVLLAVSLLAAGCAGGSSGADAGGPAGDVGDPAPSAAPEDDAGDAARRRASDRWVERGREAMEADELDEAASFVERAVRIDPSNGRAYLALAEVRIAQGRPREARGLLERALGLLPPDAEAAARADSLRGALPPSPG